MKRKKIKTPKVLHCAIYGNVKLQRQFCKDCQSTAFVIDGVLQCCMSKLVRQKEDEEKPIPMLKVSESVDQRKIPKKKEILRQLEVQGHICFYCGLPFGTPYIHPITNSLGTLKVCLDHFVPYCYSRDNQASNFVCACQICNGIKSGLVFDLIEDAIRYVRKRRIQKGYGEDNFNV